MASGSGTLINARGQPIEVALSLDHENDVDASPHDLN
jgi:hypothetical protein